MATLIAKKAPHGPAARHIVRAASLAEYIADPQKTEEMRASNLFDHDSPDTLAQEIAAICDAADATGKKKLVHHWILSTKRDGEEKNPSDETLYAASQQLMTQLGYKDCPYLVSIHANTDNKHAHIVVARVHADTGKIISDSNDIYKAQKALAIISANNPSLKPEKHNMYQVQGGEIVPRTEKPKARRGNIRQISHPDDMQTAPTPRQNIEDALADFCVETRAQWGAWKWGDMHKALALRGIEMQYTDHEGRGGLAYCMDGKTWHKASAVCPAMSYPEIAGALGASGSYRRARKGIAEIAAEARLARPAVQPPKDAPEEKKIEPPAENHAPNGARSAEKREPQKEERKPMTDQDYARINYMAFAAMQKADDTTKAVVNALSKDKLYGKEENKSFLAQQEENLKQIVDSKYTDAEAYARMRFDAARYHAKLVYDAIKMERRSAEDRMKFREFFFGHLVAAKKYTDDAMMQLRIIVQQMRMRGNSQRQIARAMQDADDDGMSDGMKAIIEFTEYSSAALADVFALPARIRDAETPLERRIHEIEKRYDMGIIPKEYREEIEAERQAAIYAAQTIDRWNRRRNSRRTGEERTEVVRKYDAHIDKLLNAILANPKCKKKQLYENIKEEVERITDNIAAGKNSKNKEEYETLRQKLAEYKTAQAVETDMQPATAMDGTIGKRHYSEAEKLAEAQGTGSIGARKIMALRMRATDKKEADAVRIMVAAGMDPGDAARAVAYVYNTQAGDAALDRAAKHAARWKQEETGRQAAGRPQGQAAARPAPRPARPKM